jgi:hypothetical protein
MVLTSAWWVAEAQMMTAESTPHEGLGGNPASIPDWLKPIPIAAAPTGVTQNLEEVPDVLATAPTSLAEITLEHEGLTANKSLAQRFSCRGSEVYDSVTGLCIGFQGWTNTYDVQHRPPAHLESLWSDLLRWNHCGQTSCDGQTFQVRFIPNSLSVVGKWSGSYRGSADRFLFALTALRFNSGKCGFLWGGSYIVPMNLWVRDYSTGAWVNGYFKEWSFGPH